MRGAMGAFEAPVKPAAIALLESSFLFVLPPTEDVYAGLFGLFPV